MAERLCVHTLRASVTSFYEYFAVGVMLQTFVLKAVVQIFLGMCCVHLSAYQNLS